VAGVSADALIECTVNPHTRRHGQTSNKHGQRRGQADRKLNLRAVTEFGDVGFAGGAMDLGAFLRFKSTIILAGYSSATLNSRPMDREGETGEKKAPELSVKTNYRQLLRARFEIAFE
jgi:hypothetical protein